jgi:hypothetical protein
VGQRQGGGEVQAHDGHPDGRQNTDDAGRGHDSV